MLDLPCKRAGSKLNISPKKEQDAATLNGFGILHNPKKPIEKLIRFYNSSRQFGFYFGKACPDHFRYGYIDIDK